MYEIKQDEEKKPKVVPFNVHFTNKILNGKSRVRNGLPLGVPHTITEKFYCKENYAINPEIVEETTKQLITKDPQDIYYKPVTENQRYGWYYTISLTDLDKNDRRLYYGKRMDHFIKLQLQTMDKKPDIVINKTEKK